MVAVEDGGVGEVSAAGEGSGWLGRRADSVEAELRKLAVSSRVVAGK